MATELAGVATLFDVATPARPEPLSVDARRTRRQADAVAAGAHPLALVRPGIRVHPDAQGSAATKANTDQRPLRCGTCIYRGSIGGYPKCLWRPAGDVPGSDGRYRNAPPRVSSGAGTDCRSWWPACTDYRAVA